MNEVRERTGRNADQQTRLRASGSGWSFSFAPLLIAFAIFSSSAFAQEQPQIQTAPPPPKIVPKSERETLNKEKTPKERTKLALEFMDDRLIKAEAANTSDDLRLMFDELGYVWHEFWGPATT